MEKIPTLYEWAGGIETLERLFRTFYEKVLKDDLLAELFRHMSPEHTKRVSHFVAEVFGGPKLYTAADHGSHAMMVGKHIGKMLTEEQRQRWVHLFLQTAVDILTPNKIERANNEHFAENHLLTLVRQSSGRSDELLRRRV